MKKILLFRPLMALGGTESAMLSLIKNLKNYEIYLAYVDDTSDQKLLDRFRKYATVGKVADFDFQFDTLIIATNRYHTFDEIKQIKRKQTILWVHYFFKLETSVFNDREEIAALDKIVVVSKTAANKLITKYPYLKSKVLIIYNVIEQEEIRKKALEPIDIQFQSCLNLVTTARICKEKGFIRMAYLATILKNKNIPFKWYVIGDNHYPERKLEMLEYFKGLDDYFVWLGFLDNPYNIMQKCDYEVLLSDDETWGLVLTEALILGVPCITTDFEAAFEQINDNNGFILSRDNLASYEEKIPDIVEKKNKLKNNVKNYYYDNNKILKEWDDLIG